ncbi:MAG: hypothetical protein KF802_10140 [Bdellovibrionaceae bacterium]|nr:hypothetical protein [Pseudobdellovibrionaceae bacterium]MBX3033771.1 hypothetical protein [Pseudobdellovibrionaceae bacterium]
MEIMLRGHNSDITVRGKRYHIQTEDWGMQNPFLVSRVFCNGAVVKTLKVPYEDALKAASIRTAEAIKMALQKQHSDVMDALIEGKLA